MSLTTQFACPKCGYSYTKTVDTNKAKNGKEARRKRTCLKCSEGFVTYEVHSADYLFLQAVRKWMVQPLEVTNQ